jgi:hypothetical protein
MFFRAIYGCMRRAMQHIFRSFSRTMLCKPRALQMKSILCQRKAGLSLEYLIVTFSGIDISKARYYTARAQKEQVNGMDTKESDHSHKQFAHSTGWRFHGLR